MKASNYWQKRFEQLKHDELLATNGSLEATKKLYNRIEQSIESDLAYWYGRYMKNNDGVSYVDAQKALSKKELAEFRWTVEEYIEKAKKLELSPEWHKTLENASIKAHVTRLESLKLQLKHHSEVLHDTLNKNLGKDLRKVYEGQYYKNLFEIQKGLGQGRLIEAIDSSFLDVVIHRPWHKDGLDFSARVWQSRDKLASTLERELTYIAIRGDSPDGAIRRISQLFGKSRSHSAMLIQTEHAAMASRAQQDAFKALDVEQFEYIATLDGKTSELCQSMDGKHFPMSEYQVGLTAPPLHPRCRSCTAPYFEDMEAPRWARDKDGKGYVIGDEVKFKDWQDEYVEAESIEALKSNNIKQKGNLKLDFSVEPKKLALLYAKDRLKQLSLVEPKITDDLVNIAKSLKSKMVGLEYRLKKEDSLARKILSDAELLKIDLKDASLKINDVLRYTVVANEEKFTNHYFSYMFKLKKKGYTINRVKNTFKDGVTYKGINTLIEKEGVVFELQFHTLQSIEVKENGLHTLYEKQRVLDVAKDRDAILQISEEMVELSSKINNPIGVERIK